jgi:hypothetical protein
MKEGHNKVWGIEGWTQQLVPAVGITAGHNKLVAAGAIYINSVKLRDLHAE